MNLDLFQNDVVDRALAEYPPRSVELFREYHSERPEIYSEFKKYALQMFHLGRKRYGAKGIMERIRWDYSMRYPDEDFKISNSFISMYARLVMEEYPELEGFFQTKRIRGITLTRKYEIRDCDFV